MESQPVPKGARYPRLAHVSKVSAFAVLLWASLGGGVVMLLEGNTVGIGLIILGFAVIAGFRARPIQRLYEAEVYSHSLPVRTFLLHAIILLLAAPFTVFFLGQLPFYMMDPSFQRGLILGGVASVIALAGLVAGLIALRRDRADQPRR